MRVDALPRTLAVAGDEADALDSGNRIGRRYEFLRGNMRRFCGLYSSCFFQIASEMAAIRRANVNFARFGFVPLATRR